MTIEVFLKLCDIKGDSEDAKHPEEIRLISWDWGMDAEEWRGLGGASGALPAKFRRFRFAHHIDVASPAIMLACASGKREAEAQVTVRRLGPSPFEFLTVKLYDVLLLSVETAVNEGHGQLYEQVTLAFDRIDLRNVPQLSTGSPGSPVRFAWDVKNHAPLP
jgi:type VI secretion system secreted protein Hcp